MRRSPLARVSAKRQAESPARAVVRRLALARDGGCVGPRMGAPGPCGGPLDVDEVVGRGRGGSHLDLANVQVLCRLHHGWKHDHPQEALAVGLSAHAPPPVPVRRVAAPPGPSLQECLVVLAAIAKGDEPVAAALARRTLRPRP